MVDFNQILNWTSRDETKCIVGMIRFLFGHKLQSLNVIHNIDAQLASSILAHKIIYVITKHFVERSWVRRKYLMALCTHGFLRNLEKRLITSSRSAARKTNASTFVKHPIVLLLNNRGCESPVLFSSEHKTMIFQWEESALRFMTSIRF